MMIYCAIITYLCLLGFFISSKQKELIFLFVVQNVIKIFLLLADRASQYIYLSI